MWSVVSLSQVCSVLMRTSVSNVNNVSRCLSSVLQLGPSGRTEYMVGRDYEAFHWSWIVNFFVLRSILSRFKPWISAVVEVIVFVMNISWMRSFGENEYWITLAQLCCLTSFGKLFGGNLSAASAWKKQGCDALPLPVYSQFLKFFCLAGDLGKENEHLLCVVLRYFTKFIFSKVFTFELRAFLVVCRSERRVSSRPET